MATVLLVACSGSERPASAPASPAETPTPTASATPAEPAPAGLDALPSGKPPRIGYVVEHRFVEPNGTIHPLPDPYGIRGITRLADGFLVEDDRVFEGYAGLTHVLDGKPIEDWSTTGPAVVGLCGEVAWGEATTSEASVQPPPHVRLEVDGLRLEQRLETHPNVVGIVDGQVLYNDRFASLNETSVARITDLRAAPRDLPLRYVVDVDEVNRRILAQVGDVPPSVMGLDDLQRLWNPAGRYAWLFRFSPDGTRVLGLSGPREYVVVDAETGAQEGGFTLPKGTFVDKLMWETERTVLLVMDGRGHAAIVRAHLDGHLELATQALRHRVGTPTYALEQRR